MSVRGRVCERGGGYFRLPSSTLTKIFWLRAPPLVAAPAACAVVGMHTRMRTCSRGLGCANRRFRFLDGRYVRQAGHEPADQVLIPILIRHASYVHNDGAGFGGRLRRRAHVYQTRHGGASAGQNHTGRFLLLLVCLLNHTPRWNFAQRDRAAKGPKSAPICKPGVVRRILGRVGIHFTPLWPYG